MNEVKPNFGDRDYTFNMDSYFDRGWNIFRQYMWGFIGFLVLDNLIISTVLSRLPFPLGNNEEGQGGILYLILSCALTAGYYIVAVRIAKKQSKTFGNFFDGFKMFLPIFLVNLVAGLLICLGLLFLIIPGIYLAVSYFFALLFVIEHRLNFWSALEASRKVVSKKWFSFFGFGFLLGLINIAGALALLVGLLVTIPFTFCATVAAFEDIVGLKTAEL